MTDHKNTTPEDIKENQDNLGNTDIQKNGEDTGVAVEAASEFHEAVERVVPKEALEQGGEADGSGAMTSSKTTKTQTTAKKQQFTIPEGKEQLIKEIDKELNSQLKKLQKEAQKARGGLFHQMDAEKLARIVADIRKIKQTLSELIHMTSEALKALYRSLFQSRGL